MALYVYRQQPSVSARELAEAVEGTRYRGSRMPIEQRVRRGDAVICWGERLNGIDGVRILNGAPISGKFEDAVRLRPSGVPTVEVSRTRPQVPMVTTNDPALTVFERAQEEARELAEVTFSRDNMAFRRGVTNLRTALASLEAALVTPLPPAPPRDETGWLGRTSDHVGGNDLLTPTLIPNYFAKKVDFVKEYRIHSFLGKSIRAGVKAPREGMTPHAWVRSWDGGWRIIYDGVTAKQRHRDLAHSAVSALGLQFGAVDIGEKSDGNLIVLEVNRAPGVENGTVEAYAKAVEGWLEQEGQR